MTVAAPEYVLARSVLLDALHALGSQRDAVILVGAQAIYVHTGDAELTTAPMTTDAHLTIDVERLTAVPELAAAMRAGGFEPGDQPGSWKGRSGVVSCWCISYSLLGIANGESRESRMLSAQFRRGFVDRLRIRVIPAGEPIAVVLAAANRDPAAYAEPERFDPGRWLRTPEPPPPLSFAFGAHFCLGASLARLEASTMLATLLAVLPEIALAPEPLRWRHTGLFRSLAALPVLPGPLGPTTPRRGRRP